MTCQPLPSARPADRPAGRRARILAVTAALVAAGCSPRATVTPAPTPDPTAVAEAEVPMPVLAEYAPRGAEPPPGWEGRTWSDILSAARGQTLTWYVEGGDQRLNEWLGDYVADMAQNRYEIAIEIVSPDDTADAVAALRNERTAGVTEGGDIDLLWLDGEHFRALREADLLYGPWAGFLPSTAYLQLDAPDVANARGMPVEGYAMPWGLRQLVLVYDSAQIQAPPSTVEALLALAEANPGAFTYPAPPDPIGSAFVRLACRELAARADIDAVLADPVTDEALAGIGPPCWQRLAGAAPSLWRQGAEYPATATALDDLYAAGEVWFTLSDRPLEADRHVTGGRFAAGTRTAVLEGGTWSAPHYLAIPATASHPAAAMVLANFLLSPEAQFAKADPANWSDLTVLDPGRIEAGWRQAFLDIPRGPASLSLATLTAAARPEPHASWIEALDAGWRAEVPAP